MKTSRILAIIMAVLVCLGAYEIAAAQHNFPSYPQSSVFSASPVKWAAPTVKQHAQQQSPIQYRPVMKVRPVQSCVTPVFLPAAQSVQPRNEIVWGIEPRVSLLRTQISLGETWEGTLTQTIPRLSLMAVMNPVRIRGTVTRAFSHTGEMMPTATGNGTAIVNPIALGWKHGDTYSIEASTSSGFIRPTITGKWLDLSLTTTTNTDGRVTTDTRQWKPFLWGGGVTFSQQYPGLTAEFSLLGGDQFAKAEALGAYRINSSCLLIGGYVWEETRLEGLKIRQAGPWLGFCAER